MGKRKRKPLAHDWQISADGSFSQECSRCHQRRGEPYTPCFTKRFRRNPYQQALEQAEKRLGLAVAELMKCQIRERELNIEIPKLREMVRVIERYFAADAPSIYGTEIPASMMDGDVVTIAHATPAANGKGFATVPVPDHLKKFLQPAVHAEPDVDTFDPDNELLPEPDGRPLIPEE